jgi:hypothetical protein
MFVSQARIDANRANSRKSCGPKTYQGKLNSRANALTHALCASVCVPEDVKVVLGRASMFFDTLRPQNDFQAWVVGESALITWKIDRAGRIDRRVRDKIAIKAETGWDDARKLEAILLGEQLANRPAVVVEKLKATPQGCEWLMARWAMLAYAAESKEGWTASQVQVAFDLLATPAEFREGHAPGVEIDLEGRVIDPGANPAAVARREIEALKARIEVVSPLDEANRALAMADLDDDQDPELKRVRRYEGSLHSRLRWCMKQLQEGVPTRQVPAWLKTKWLGQQEELDALMKQALAEAEAAAQVEAAPVPDPEPIPEPDPVPEPKPEWEVNRKRVGAPFELEPHEIPPIGQSPDFDQILSNRKARRRQKAEDLRQTRRRQAARFGGV